MGKFDQVLLISDYDDTLVYTRDSFENDAPMPEMAAYNRKRICDFMAEGGTFALVTGRSWPLIRPFFSRIPTNAPCGIDNGAAIVDPASGGYLYLRPLPEGVLDHLREIRRAFPELCCELFGADHSCAAFQPCAYTYRHAKNCRYTFRTIRDFDQAGSPLLKVLFEGDARLLDAIRRWALAQGWAGEYELVFSGSSLLEMVAAGANKGVLSLEMAKLCGKSPDHLYCVGDQQNDLPMLKAARRGFCPSNAVEAVRAAAQAVGHCREGAVGQVIDILETLY